MNGSGQRWQRVLLGLVSAGLLFGCAERSDSTGGTDASDAARAQDAFGGDAAGLPADPEAGEQEFAWGQWLELRVDDRGHSEPFLLAADDAGVLVVEVTSPDGEPFTDVCPILEEVIGPLETWVAATGHSSGFFCTDCRHRVHLGYGHGLFAFPNDGTVLPADVNLSAQVSLRDCASRLEARRGFNDVPPEVRVRVGSRRRIDTKEVGRLAVRIGIAASADALPDTVPQMESALDIALTEAGRVLAPAGIELTTVGVHRLEAAASMQRFGPTDYTALEGPLAELSAEAHEVPIVLLPCLVWEDTWTGTELRPSGHVPRIPGGYGYVDGIFLRVGGCGPLDPALHWTSPEALGRALAHELGHYLGLYHVAESHGAPDHLADTSPDIPNLMQPTLGDTDADTALTSGQIAVIRSHPYIRFPN